MSTLIEQPNINVDLVSDDRLMPKILDKYSHLRITTDTVVHPPDPVISIDKATIATVGNIITISGVPKGGKSALSSIFIAGAISSDGLYDGFLGINVSPNPVGAAVIQFDTEQAMHKQKQNLQSILNA
jgi:hypothetical protein